MLIILLDHDFDAERSFRERGINRSVRFIACSGIVKNQILMKQIQDIMQLLQKEYEYPVDIEFTVNLSETGEYSINLLQCRSLKVFKDIGKAQIPENNCRRKNNSGKCAFFDGTVQKCENRSHCSG